MSVKFTGSIIPQGQLVFTITDTGAKVFGNSNVSSELFPMTLSSYTSIGNTVTTVSLASSLTLGRSNTISNLLYTTNYTKNLSSSIAISSPNTTPVVMYNESNLTRSLANSITIAPFQIGIINSFKRQNASVTVVTSNAELVFGTTKFYNTTVTTANAALVFGTTNTNTIVQVVAST